MPVPVPRSPVQPAGPKAKLPPRSSLRVQPVPPNPSKGQTSFLILSDSGIDAPGTESPVSQGTTSTRITTGLPSNQVIESPSSSSSTLSSASNASTALSKTSSRATSLDSGGRDLVHHPHQHAPRSMSNKSESAHPIEITELASATVVLEEVEKWLEYINKRMGQLERRHRKKFSGLKGMK